MSMSSSKQGENVDTASAGSIEEPKEASLSSRAGRPSPEPPTAARPDPPEKKDTMTVSSSGNSSDGTKKRGGTTPKEPTRSPAIPPLANGESSINAGMNFVNSGAFPQTSPVSRGFSRGASRGAKLLSPRVNKPPPIPPTHIANSTPDSSVLGPNSYVLDEVDGMMVDDAVSESDSWSSASGIGDYDNEDEREERLADALRKKQTRFEDSMGHSHNPGQGNEHGFEEVGQAKTFVSQLNEDLHPILEKYQCASVEDLVKVLKLYSQSVNNLRRASGVRTADEHYFSFRQFASWKLALSHEREEQMKDIEQTRIEDNEESIFSELPLERDDHAETELEDWQLDYYVTSDQKVEQSIVDKWVKYSFLITFLTIVVQLLAFFLIVIRCCFEIPADGAGYACQLIFLDIPLMLHALQNIFAVREERGIFRVRIQEGAFKHVQTASFWVDMLGFFPMEIAGFAAGSQCTIFTNTCGFIAPYWQINKLLLCRTVLNLFGELTDQIMFKLSISPSMGRIFGVFVQFAIVCHASCGAAMLLCLNDPDLGKSWLHSHDFFTTLSESEQYFQLLDWATKTIVGFAKGEPFNLPDEVLLVQLIVSIVGIVLFATLISSVNNYLSRPSDFNITRKKVDEAMDEMRRRDLPEELVKEVVGYYWHCFDTSGFQGNPSEMLANLPKKLQIKLMLDMGRQRVERVPMLSNQAGHKEFVMCLSIALIPETLLPRTILFRKGDTADSMAFVIYGACGVVPLDYYDTHQVLFVIRPGSFFGEIALIVGGRRTATIASLGSWVNLLWLRRANFLQLAEDFPEAVHEMERKAHERLNELKNNAERERQVRMDALADATNKVRIFAFWIEWQRFCDFKHNRGEFAIQKKPAPSLKLATKKFLAIRKTTALPKTSHGGADRAGGSMSARDDDILPSPKSGAAKSPAPNSAKTEVLDIAPGSTPLFNLESTAAPLVVPTSARGRHPTDLPGSRSDREARPWSSQRLERSSSVSSLYRQQHPGMVPYEPGGDDDY